MFAYTFSETERPFSGQYVYAAMLDALEYAKGAVYTKYRIIGEHENDGVKISADRAEIVSQGDATESLKKFARRCAYRTLATLSGAQFSNTVPGLNHWLNNGKTNPYNWNYLRYWAAESKMTWMAGGHAEGSICRSVLAHSDPDLAYYHAWAAAYHAKALLGKRIEIPRQKKSLTQYLNRVILEMG